MNLQIDSSLSIGKRAVAVLKSPAVIVTHSKVLTRGSRSAGEYSVKFLVVYVIAFWIRSPRGRAGCKRLFRIKDINTKVNKGVTANLFNDDLLNKPLGEEPKRKLGSFAVGGADASVVLFVYTHF